MPRRDPLAWIGLAAFFALVLLALFGERIAPHEAISYVVEHGSDPRPYDPGLVFPLGSDLLGRDLLSLVLAGARLTLAVVLGAGLARVGLALVLAAIGTLSARARFALDAASEVVAAVPATLVVLLIVLVFVRGDTTFAVFVGALLVTGWAGPYRVLRVELDRLSGMAFSEGAATIGLGRVRILWRHHVPHLAPMLALNASQQAVASLVALAELGVLGVFVGTTRFVNLEASLSRLRGGQRSAAFIADPPEWGGLLANARDIESLWTTRWVFLVPGVAFALAAVAIAAVGVGVSRRYARRDVLADLRGRGAAGLLFAVAALVVIANVIPERYAEARGWAADARSQVAVAGDLATTFAEAGLRPVGSGYTVERDVAQIRATAPATIAVAQSVIRESQSGAFDVLPLLYSESGGGSLRAPLVFASWGLSPADYPSLSTSLFGPPDLGKTIADWPDDYANVDVRGKVVVLLRVMGIAAGTRRVTGPDAETSIANALKRGAAGVLFVDPDLPRLPRVPTNRSANIYLRLMASSPVRSVTGRPVVVLSVPAADRLLAATGLVPSREYAALDSFLIPTDGDRAARSVARPLLEDARIDVPIELSRAHVRSVVGEVPDAEPGAPRVMVWAVVRRTVTGSTDAADVVSAVARAVSRQGVPLVFVAFDPSVDPQGNAVQIADRLAGLRIGLIVVLDELAGSALTFTSPYGDLLPAIDLYAERAGARYTPTRSTLSLDSQAWVWPGIGPFIGTKSVLVRGDGTTGDLRPDSAALLGYLAGRLSLKAEELPR